MRPRPIHEAPAWIDEAARTDEGTPSGAVTLVVSRMQVLREATRDAHTRIERVLPLLEPGLTRARYTRVLEAFYGFYAPLEPSIARAAATEGAALALELRAKLPLLATDLRALGQTPAEIEALPRCRDLPVLESASHAIGILYVMEGATLGGQIIRRHLRDGAEIDASSGAAFFTGYGATTGAMWARFVDHVNQSTTIETDAAVRAAVHTFQTLTQWLQASLGPS